MQNAPSVVYPVGRSAFYAAVMVGLGVCSGLGLFVGWWSAWQAAPDHVLSARWTLGVVAWVGWMILAGWCWMWQPVGSLRWDPQATPQALDGPPGAWLWLPDHVGAEPMTVQPEALFDWQGCWLLYLRGPVQRGHWVWLERRQNPSRWDDVRRALVALR